MPIEKTRLERFSGKKAKEVFTEIYETNDWGSEESKSGKGSTIEITSIIRSELPIMFEKYQIKRLFDGACGDFNWMKEIVSNLDYYTGCDIVTKLIIENNKKYATDNINFYVNDITSNPIGNGYDAVFLRDVLVHLPTKSVQSVLNKIKESDAKYFITSNFKDIKENIDLESFGLWRPINLEIEPFNLGEPLEFIHESNQLYSINGHEFKDKCLSIWEIKR